MSILVINLQSYPADCYFCGAETGDKLGIAMSEGEQVPDDFDGDWYAVAACRKCYEKSVRNWRNTDEECPPRRCIGGQMTTEQAERVCRALGVQLTDNYLHMGIGVRTRTNDYECIPKWTSESILALLDAKDQAERDLETVENDRVATSIKFDMEIAEHEQTKAELARLRERVENLETLLRHATEEIEVQASRANNAELDLQVLRERTESAE